MEMTKLCGDCWKYDPENHCGYEDRKLMVKDPADRDMLDEGCCHWERSKAPRYKVNILTTTAVRLNRVKEKYKFKSLDETIRYVMDIAAEGDEW